MYLAFNAQIEKLYETQRLLYLSRLPPRAIYATMPELKFNSRVSEREKRKIEIRVLNQLVREQL